MSRSKWHGIIFLCLSSSVVPMRKLFIPTIRYHCTDKADNVMINRALLTALSNIH